VKGGVIDMPLTWNVEHVENHQEVTTLHTDEGDQWHPVTMALVYLTMSTGIGRITEANAGEFYARTNLLERLVGPQLIRPEGEDGERPTGYAAFITPDEVRAHVGLATNACFKDEPRSKWLKRVLDREMSTVVARYGKAVVTTAA